MRASRSWVVAVAVSMVTAMPAGASPATTRSTPLRPSRPSIAMTGGPSPFYDLDVPQVGSSDYLVYYRQPYQSSEVTELVRRRDGGTTVLAAGSRAESIEPSSLVGQSLTGADDYAISGADWWNLATGKSGVLKLPHSVTFLGSTPDGVLAVTSHGELQDWPRSGAAARSLGTPFAAAPTGSVPDEVSGAQGAVLVDDSGAAVYLRWSHPGRYRSLEVGADGDSDVGCSAIAAAAAGCFGTDAKHHPVIMRVPLNGSAPVLTTLARSACPDDVFVTVSSTAWDDGCAHVLHSVPAVAGTPVSHGPAFVQEGAGLVGAFGEFVTAVDRAGKLSLAGTKTASGARRAVVGAIPTPVEAGHIALTSGRVAYYDDQRRAVELWEHAVGGPPSTVDLGPAVSLGQPGTGGDINIGGGPVLSVSGANTAAAGTAHSLTIRSPIRHATLLTKDSVQNVEISGDRVTFDNEADAHPSLYDLRSGHLTTLSAAISASVSGPYLAYVEANGSVWRRRLGPHHTPVELRGPLTHGQPIDDAEVYSFGDEVVWRMDSESDKPPFLAEHDGYRDARTLTPARAISHRYLPEAATSDGVLELGDVGKNVKYYLQHYGSTDRSEVVSISSHSEQAREPDEVAVNGDRIAWIDSHDRARIAALPIAASPDRPRYLGDAVTGAASGHMAKTPWRAFIPLSAALASCAVTIYHHAVALRTIRCRLRDARLGDAVVRWDGLDAAGHRVGRGTYRWQLNAGNRYGQALTADGGHAPIQGRIILR